MSFRLGQVRLDVVSDGVYHADGGGPFGLVPRALWSRHYTPDAENRIPMALNCLLIRTPSQTILIDTGLGDKLSEKGRRIFGLQREKGLVENLAELRVAPEDVDIVLNTHLHADHCGGNTRYEDGRVVATFPRARCWMQRLELAEAMYPNERTQSTYLRENFAPLEAAEALHLMYGDTQVTPEVRTVITRGHTRAHQSVIIESEGQTAVFLADLSFLTIHLERLAWVSSYDVEPLETIETKRAMRDFILRHDALLFFEHEVRTPVGRLRREGDELRVEAV